MVDGRTGGDGLPDRAGSDGRTVSQPSTLNPQPILSVRDLKTYFFPDEGTVRAVDGASFDVYPGQTLGIVGESGCGKSVTARSILRIVERPGRIVDGQIILRQDAGRHDADLEQALGRGREVDLARLDEEGRQMRSIRGGVISLVFQEPMTSFSPVHTIGNQIVEAIRFHRRVSTREARDRAIELLKRVGIPRAEQRMDEYAFQLSGGLRQRAMIAMALSCDPILLIADEPTTALDVTTQAQILDLLQELQRQTGMAIMLITHNLGVIAEMADEVVVMYLGRVVEEGPVDDIFHNPQHPYTRALLQSIPSINSEPRVKLPTISGSIPHPYNRPAGCPFHPRCQSFMAGTCDRFEPRLLPVADRQRVSCFLYHAPADAAAEAAAVES
ncbi:MAG TPA: ABC transporter ATP-binding protein [Chloroflexota bacterium]|jgi:peptide/nickel transport system ATP-binding protein|nr:ABC transporter ATP-binding protein [Chloroflexota bacterium]